MTWEDYWKSVFDMNQLELIEQTGALRALLLISEKQRFVTELRKTSVNPTGIMSQDALRKVRLNLSELGLIIEEIEEGPRPKTFLVITEKGRRVAQKVAEMLEILDED